MKSLRHIAAKISLPTAFVLGMFSVACSDSNEEKSQDPPSTHGGQTTNSTNSTPPSTSGEQATGTSSSTDSAGPGPGDSLTPTKLPQVTGTCPTFAEGELEFQPQGLSKPRKVVVWVSDKAKTLDGPLLFYWHGANGSPTNAPRGLGPMIDAVKELGGIVAAPYHDPDAGTFPWFLVGDPTGAREDDLLLADEILACAIKNVGVDLRRIHSVGMSAGGLQTAQMSFRRSNYIASVAPYSGGFVETLPELQNPSNKLSAMIFHGGETDVVVLKFKETSERYLQNLEAKGGFGFICDHGNGHKGPIDALDSVWKFLSDHPYNVSPKPYASGLPEGFPDYCKLSN